VPVSFKIKKAFVFDCRIEINPVTQQLFMRYASLDLQF